MVSCSITDNGEDSLFLNDHTAKLGTPNLGAQMWAKTRPKTGCKGMKLTVGKTLSDCD